MVGEQLQGVQSHPQRLKCGERFVAMRAQVKFLTKCRRDAPEEQIGEGHLRRKRDKNIQWDKSFEFSLNISEQDSFSEEEEQP